MKQLITLGIAACAALLVACTWRGSYESIRQSARNECQRELSDAERKACLERMQDSFDEYMRKRQAVQDEHDSARFSPSE